MMQHEAIQVDSSQITQDLLINQAAWQFNKLFFSSLDFLFFSSDLGPMSFKHGYKETGMRCTDISKRLLWLQHQIKGI